MTEFFCVLRRISLTPRFSALKRGVNETGFALKDRVLRRNDAQFLSVHGKADWESPGVLAFNVERHRFRALEAQ